MNKYALTLATLLAAGALWLCTSWLRSTQPTRAPDTHQLPAPDPAEGQSALDETIVGPVVREERTCSVSSV